MTTRAFAPGHVSGVFAVHDEAPELLRKGSRGVGWSVDKGATATVSKSSGPTVITVNGEVSDAHVTRTALAILSDQPVDVALQLDLPIGQGFGMSAAGSLAACLAATNELGLEPEKALEAAHAAEVESGTGLGDAVGSWFGAGEIRLKPGCPPDGWAMRVDPPPGVRFLFCVLGEGISTPKVIRNQEWKRRTRDLGDPFVDRVIAAGRPMAWSMLLEASSEFTRLLGLMPPRMQDLGRELPPGLRWGQGMLGNTMWVTGPAAALEAARPVLAAAGTLIECGMDGNGARLVR